MGERGEQRSIPFPGEWRRRGEEGEKKGRRRGEEETRGRTREEETRGRTNGDEKEQMRMRERRGRQRGKERETNEVCVLPSDTMIPHIHSYTYIHSSSPYILIDILNRQSPLLFALRGGTFRRWTGR